MTRDEAQAALDETLSGRETPRQRRLLAGQLRAVTKALPPGSGPMAGLSGDLVSAAELLES